MTVSSTHSNKVYVANGTQTEFTFDFKCYDEDHLQVFFDYSSTAESTGDYTVSIDTDYEGGTVTFTTAPTSGTVVDISRIQPLTQSTDYPVGGAFPSESHEKALDYLVMIAQQQQRVLEDGTGYTPVAGAWSTSTDYYRNQWVSSGTKWYYCAIEHTSGTFATDLANGLWVYFMDADASADAISAAASAAAALASENAASASETNAATSESNASTSASAASTSETNAGLSSVSAQGYRDLAYKWAEEDVDVEVATGLYSAKHYASKTGTYLSDTEDAKDAAVVAQGLAEDAQDAAETAQGLAEDAQSAAESAQSAAESAYDSFDDRYLGAKASEPAIDNDGGALVTGALYFNTASEEMKVYTGSSWEAAYVPAGSYLTTSDVDDTPVDGETTAPVSSNWAYDHTAAISHPQYLGISVSDEESDLETGTAKVTFRAPHAMTLTAIRASVATAPTGAALEVDINEGGVSIFSTVLSIDAGEKTSTTATTAAVISDANIADDAEITIDIDQVGSSVAGAGLKVVFYYTVA